LLYFLFFLKVNKCSVCISRSYNDLSEHRCETSKVQGLFVTKHETQVNVAILKININ